MSTEDFSVTLTALNEMEKLASEIQGKSLRPGLIRAGIIIALASSGAGFLWVSFLLKSSHDFTSSILTNIGCELIGSIVILLAIDYLAHSLQLQSKKEKLLLEKIQEIRQISVRSGQKAELPSIASDIPKTR